MANSSNYSHVQRQAARKSTPQLPMNWFKFLIYCQLFLTALSELSNAYLYLTGNVYASEPGVQVLVTGIAAFLFLGILQPAVPVGTENEVVLLVALHV